MPLIFTSCHTSRPQGHQSTHPHALVVIIVGRHNRKTNDKIPKEINLGPADELTSGLLLSSNLP